MSTPDYARLTVGSIRSSLAENIRVDFSHEGLSKLTTINKTFFVYGTGSFFLLLWDENKLISICDKFAEKGKPNAFKNAFRTAINQACEDYMKGDHNGMKENLAVGDIAKLKAGFGGWWGQRVKNLTPKENEEE